MVATFAPSICHTNTVQDLTALPFTCTTQAPHWDVSQPTCVPVSRRFSRRNCTRSVRGSTSPVTALPFTVSATAVMALLLEIRPKASFSHRTGGPAADRGVLDVFSSLTGLRLQPAPHATTDAEGHFDRPANLSLVVPPIINMTAPS